MLKLMFIKKLENIAAAPILVEATIKISAVASVLSQVVHSNGTWPGINYMILLTSSSWLL